MKKISLFLLAFILVFSPKLTAQTNAGAAKIISDLLAEVKAKTIKTSFKLEIVEKNNSRGQLSTGHFTLFGNKFILEMTDMKVFFDGKTQWAYMPQNNEVSITEPTDKELSETNPMAILSGFKAKSQIRFSTKFKSAQNYYIEMIPKIKQQGIEKIELVVSKSSKNLLSIKVFNSQGSTSTLTLSNFKKTAATASINFGFQPGKYKGIVINDLR